MRTLKPWLLGFVVWSGLSGCGSGANGAPGASGADALVAVTDVAPGADCEFGGAKVEFGVDDDADGKLDASEVDGTSYACNGAPGGDGAPGENGGSGADGASGKNALITATEEAPGDNCLHGGQRIDQGMDEDADGALDGNEILTTSYVCNGGDGSSGENGSNALVSVVGEPAGANCSVGGIALRHGLDSDGDGTLDANEADGVNYVCDGENGLSGKDGLVNVLSEAAGGNCATGGVRVDFGLDDDDNGMLDSAEVDGTRYVCNGAVGSSGKNSLVNVTAEGEGANCADGGQKIQVGLDANADSALGDGEVTQTQYVCDGADGADGHHARIVVSDVVAGATCPAGGKLIAVGVDADGNGTLESGEISQSDTICAGVDGSDGAEGLSTLATLNDEPAGSHCPAGGKRLDIGVDANGDAALAPGEVTETEYLCHGVAGANGSNGMAGADAVANLVSTTAEPAGINCASGGQHIQYGLDDDGNGSLAPAEIDGGSYVCNGANGSNGASGSNGLNSLVNVVNEAAGMNCAVGGERITYGLDDDRNGVLAAAEVDGTRYVCDGAAGAMGTSGSNGFNSLVSVVNEAAGMNCAAGGELITYGLDDDRDGILDAGEVDGTRYVCDGAAGTAGSNGTNGLNSLVSVVDEPVGMNCATGGERINYGLDDDRNGALAPAEVDGFRYVCNGAAGANGTNGTNGTNGLNNLISVVAEPIGMNCAAGGQRIQTGLDDDANGTLAAGEVDNTSYVCNGAT